MIIKQTLSSAINQVVQDKQEEIQNLIKNTQSNPLLVKITNIWKQGTEHDQNILYQRCLFILKQEIEERTSSQAKQVQSYFEKNFRYINQLKGQLSSDLYLKIFKSFELEEIEQFRTVFHYGEKGRKMYFILDGEIGVLIPQDNVDLDKQMIQQNYKRFEDFIIQQFPEYKVVAIKKKNDHFGEIAIEQRVPRTATVVTKTNCIFATLCYEAYQSILGLLQEQIMRRKLELIRQIPPFKNWIHSAQYVFLHNCEEIQFDTNNIIYKRFNKCDSVYLIVEGEVLIQKWELINTNENEIFIPRGEKMSTLGLYSKGQIIGDYEIYLTQMKQNYVKRCTTAKCTLFTKALKIPILQFIENLKNNETEKWINNFFEDKFNKKWIKKELSTLSVTPTSKKYYVMSRQSSNLFRVSCNISRESSIEYENENPTTGSFITTYSKDLQMLQKQNRKYFPSTRQSPQKQSVSTILLVKNLKQKVQSYKQKEEPIYSGVHSFSLFPKSKNDITAESPLFQSTSTLFTPGNRVQKRKIKIKSFSRVEHLYKN